MRYMLTIRLPMEEVDDCGARMRARDVLQEANLPGSVKVKLQKMFPGQEPIGMRFDMPKEEPRGKEGDEGSADCGAPHRGAAQTA